MSQSIAHHYQRFTLANGLEVVLYPDTSNPIVTAMLWYRVGSKNEIQGQTGVSHFLEHMLFKGSRNFAKGSIDELTLLCGGNNNAYTWLDATAYFFNLPASHWELALQIESDRMQGALLERAEIEAERQVILEEWQSSQDDPDERFWEQLNLLAIPEHAYRNPVLGWPQDIRSLNREQLAAYYQQHYHPNHAVLILAGDLPANALQRVEHYFASLPAGPEYKRESAFSASLPRAQRLWLPSPDIQLPRLIVTWPAPALSDPDYAPMIWLHYLLTEGWSSRLHQALVEKAGIASEVSSILFETQDPYLFWIQLDLSENESLETDSQEAALAIEQLLWQQLDQLLQAPIAEAEWQRVKNQLLTDYHLQQETTQELAEFLGEMLVSGDWGVLERYQRELESVTPADIQRVAQHYLNPEYRIIGWLWPQKSKESDSETRDVTGSALELTGLSAAGSDSSPLKHSHLHEYRQNTPCPADLTHRVHLAVQPAHMPVLELHQKEFDNGFKALIHPYAKTPTFSFSCWVQAGSHFDPPGQSGLANLCLSALIKGTHKRSALAYAEALESLGANLSISAGINGVYLDIAALSQHFEPIMALVYETLSQPALTADEINKEKRLILADLQVAQESSGFMANCALLKAVYGQSAAALPVEGEIASLKKLKAQDVQAFYQGIYGPQGGILALSGDLDPAQAQRCLRDYFGSWQAMSQSHPTVPEFQKAEQMTYQHIAISGRDQCTLLLGHLGVSRQDPDFVKLMVLDVILGNGPGFSSRIPRRLRDQQGLAYYVNLSTTTGAQVWPGMVQAQVETSPDKALECLSIILQEIRKLQQDGISEKELASAKAYLSGRFSFLFESNAQRTGYLLQQAFYGWPVDYLNRYLQELQACTIHDIQAVACQHLDSYAYHLISAGARPAWNPDILTTI